ncbi:hypothetical protein ABZ605_28150 [Streptomyces sp. NPDC012765]|uniref:hypothetical protein n=1 Tax=Streptomyces sp. NPDC012765 TaxID=3155249 RepID=UPI0033C18A72
MIPTLIGFLAGAVVALLGVRLYRWLRPGARCDWCTQTSHWPVFGHQTLQCEGYHADVASRTSRYSGGHRPND